MSEITRAGFTVKEFAEKTTLSRSNIYNLIKSGEVRIVKIGSRTIIPATEVDRLFDADAE